MESSGIAESTNQKKRTTWTKPAISCLLSFLINNKEELEKLNCTRGGNNHSAPLWNSASKNLEEFGHNYSSEQTFIYYNFHFHFQLTNLIIVAISKIEAKWRWNC